MTLRNTLAGAARLRWRLLKPLLEKTGAIAVVFRRWERRSAANAGVDFDDGHPMPGPDLLVSVAGTPNQEWFSVRGRRDAEMFAGLAARHGMTVTEACVVIDFGCGCGRIARWLAPQVIGGGGAFLGFDVNPRLAAWCAEHLPGAYARNALQPPLACATDTVDILYAYSVLTHLREATVIRWLAEIARVLRPGGLAMLTFHDEAFAALFAPPETQAALATQDYVVFNDALEGSNYISAWTTAAHLTRLAAPWFEVAEITPGQADRTQAIAVLRKR